MAANDITDPNQDSLPDDIEDEAKDKQNKKKDKKKGKNKAGDEKKKGFPLIPILVLLVIIGAITAVLAFDLFGIRERYVMPYLREAPLIGAFMPAAPETGDETDPADTQSAEELQQEVNMLNWQVQKLQDDLKTAQDQNNQDRETIAVLREYESRIEGYNRVKEEFDAMITSQNPNDFARFYESVSPENAERLYQEAVSDAQYTSEERRNAQIYANMNADSAAAVLEQMLSSGANLVVRILKNMDSTNVSEIMNELTPANAAIIGQMLAPTPAPAAAVRTAPPVP